MKKLIIAITLGLCVFGAQATDVATSQAYVDTAAAGLQDNLPAKTSDKVVTYTTTPGATGEREIKTTLGNESTNQADSGLATVGTVSTAIDNKQDALEPLGNKNIVTYSATAGAPIATPIYNTSGSISANALVDAKTLNDAVIAGVNAEVTRIPTPKGTLWRFNRTAPRVLPTYTRLEYLESTGTQYIDTGIAPTNATGLKVKFNKYIQGDQVVVGDLSSDTTQNIYINAATEALFLPFAERYSYAAAGAYSYNTDYEVSMNYMNDRKRYVNGASKGNITNTLTTNTNTIYLFAGHSAGGAANWFFKGRIYYLQMTDGQTLARNMIPVRRDSDGVLGMYDTVSGAFFTNAATSGADFTAGPVASYIPQNQ